jgi:ABC-type uncharacterized transport system fused permease/ATPase subunit
VRVRENAESIAFYGGEALEREAIEERLERLVTSRREIIAVERNLDFFTTAYQFLIQILPGAVVAPLYFAGSIELGVVSQSFGAFNHILNDFSIIVNQFEALSSFRAGVDRLGEFTMRIQDESGGGAAALLGDQEEEEEKKEGEGKRKRRSGLLDLPQSLRHGDQSSELADEAARRAKAALADSPSGNSGDKDEAVAVADGAVSDVLGRAATIATGGLLALEQQQQQASGSDGRQQEKSDAVIAATARARDAPNATATEAAALQDVLAAIEARVDERLFGSGEEEEEEEDEALTAGAAAPSAPAVVKVRVERGADAVRVKGLTLLTPDRRRTLIRGLDLDLSAATSPSSPSSSSSSSSSSSRLLVVGDSGSGKSSLLRAIAGLWGAGEGEVVRPPSDEMLFLPQRPYCTLGTLRDQLLYPQIHRGEQQQQQQQQQQSANAAKATESEATADDEASTEAAPAAAKAAEKAAAEALDAQLLAILEEVRLGGLAAKWSPGGAADPRGGLDAEVDWSSVLSLGEQQRLAFGRLLFNRPRVAILDEATSALDIDSERAMYEALQRVEGCSYLSVGHRPSLSAFHDHRLRLRADGGGHEFEPTGLGPASSSGATGLLPAPARGPVSSSAAQEDNAEDDNAYSYLNRMKKPLYNFEL